MIRLQLFFKVLEEVVEEEVFESILRCCCCGGGGAVVGISFNGIFSFLFSTVVSDLL